VTATITGATPATYQLSVLPAKAATADVQVAIAGPADAGDNTDFTETFTVTDNGPDNATNIIAGLTIPPGVAPIAVDGASHFGPLLGWSIASLAPAGTVSYTIVFAVDANVHRTVAIAVAAASLNVRDPDLANNAAFTTIHLG
jgi:hypothetical protein